MHDREGIGALSSLRVPHAPASAALVRHRMAAELGSQLPVDVLDAAELVVSELVGNAVRHGAALPGGGLVARWELAGRQLLLEVVDGGDGPPHTARSRAPLTAESGRGLELVQALAERWGSRPAQLGTAVWAELPTGDQLP